MTGNEENETTEELTTAAQAAVKQESMDDEFENEFANDDEFGTDELEAGDDELTPNDIFGLDPLDVLTLEELRTYVDSTVLAPIGMGRSSEPASGGMLTS